MRIRSIRPEFWRSEDVKKYPRDVRLLFVGLWSYVDDNGVGVDDYRQIAADLFPLDDDPMEVREYVREGLARLSRGLQITRYEVTGKRYLLVTNFDNHQKVDRPGKSRYPRPEELPTSGDDGPKFGHPDDSRDLRDSLDAGEGEKGRRGEGEKHSATPASQPDLFDAFWDAYPRKVGKAAAEKAWPKAVKKLDAERLVKAAGYWAGLWQHAKTDKQFIPHPATWLNGKRWDDEPPVPKLQAVSGGYVPFQNPANHDDYYEDL